MSRKENYIRKKREAEQRKKQRRLDDRDKLLLEERLVREGKIYPRAHYMPRGRFRGILAVCLALFLGIFIGIGGLLGVGVWLGTKKSIGSVLSLAGIGQDTYSKYLDDAYAEMSVLDLLKDVINNPFNCLNDVSKYSPFFDETMDKLLNKLKDFGVEADKETLMSKKFSELGSYLKDDVLMNVSLGKALGLDVNSSALMLTFCFGEEDVDYRFEANGSVAVLNEDAVLTIKKLTSREGLDGIFETMQLGSLLGINREVTEEKIRKNSAMYALSYGSYGSDYTIENGKIKMAEGHSATTIGDFIGGSDEIIQRLELEALLGSPTVKTNDVMFYVLYGPSDRYDRSEPDGEGKITVTMREGFRKRTIKDLTEDDFSDLKVSDIISVDEHSSKFLQAVKDWSLNDFAQKEKIESLKIEDILDIDPDASGFMKAAAGWKISDLQNMNRIQRLKIGQILGIDDDSSAIMKAMRDWRISDLTDQSKIDSLTLRDVIDLGTDPSGILAALADSPIGELNDRVQTLRLSEILGEEACAGNKILKHLGDSSVTTLADDLALLTVSQVFGDEMYSYMAEYSKEIDGKAVTVTYDWLESTYFAEAGKETRKNGLQSVEVQLYNFHEQKYNYNTEDAEGNTDHMVYRPKALDLSSVSVQSALYAGGDGAEKEVVRKFYLDADGRTPVPEGATVSYDSKSKTYGFDTVVKLEPVYAYYEYDYAAGAIKGEALDVTVKEDDYGFYYETSIDGKTERIDLERVIESYRADGKTYKPANGKIEYEGASYTVRSAKPADGPAYDYITVRTAAYELFRAETGEVFQKDQTSERYFYMSGEQKVNVDRYLSGVWYLLFNGKTTDGKPLTETPILNVDSLISDVANTMNDALFAELWFHGILEENPYAPLATNLFKDGIAFEHTDSKGNHKTRVVKNLIEVSLSETFALISSLNDQISKLPSLGL